MSTVTTLSAAEAWRPDVVSFPPADAIPDALVVALTTHVATVEGDAPAVRIPVADDTAADIVPEGDTITEDAPELAERLLFTVKVGKLQRVSREQFAHDNTADRLANAAARALVVKADDIWLNAPAPQPDTAGVTGILNQGIVTGGTITDDLDGLIDIVSTLQTNGATPSHLLLAPNSWAALRKLKTGSTSNQSLIGAGVEDATLRLLGLTVVVNAKVPVGEGLVLDTADIVSAYSEISVAQSDDFYFNSDSVAVRSTFRFGSTTVHPNRHAVFTVTI